MGKGAQDRNDKEKLLYNFMFANLVKEKLLVRIVEICLRGTMKNLTKNNFENSEGKVKSHLISVFSFMNNTQRRIM